MCDADTLAIWEEIGFSLFVRPLQLLGWVAGVELGLVLYPRLPRGGSKTHEGFSSGSSRGFFFLGDDKIRTSEQLAVVFTPAG